MQQHRHGQSHEHGHGHEHEHGHGHEHEPSPGAHAGHAHDPAALLAGGLNARMALAVGLNLAFVAVEGCFGILSNSMALLADAGHNLSDVLGLVAAWAAVYLARRPPVPAFTYGLGRSTVLAALGNAVLLLVACGAIAWEALGRLAAPPPVAGATVIAVAGAGILINGASAWLLHAGHRHDLNMRSAFLHMLGDAAVSAGVMISGLVIMTTGWRQLDPVVSLTIIAVILLGTWKLLRDALHLSLDGVPAGVSPAAVQSFLAAGRGVTDVHDLHIWALSTTSVALPAHLVMPDGDQADTLLGSLSPDLKRRFRIDHATVQIERDRCDRGCGT